MLEKLMGETQSQIATGDVQLAPDINPGSIILVIVFLVAMLVGAYYLTKYVGKRALQKGMKQKPASGGRWRTAKSEPGRLISVADRIAIDRDKTIMVVEFHGRYYLLSTTPQEINCIDNIPVPPEDSEREQQEAEEREEAQYAQQPPADLSFFGVMKNVGGELKNRTYAFFHKGQLPPKKQTFESQLKEKLEKEEAKNSGSATDGSKE